MKGFRHVAKVGDNGMNIQKGNKNSKRKAETKSKIPIRVKGKAVVPFEGWVRTTRQSTKKNLPLNSEKNKQLPKEANSRLPDDVVDFDKESGDDPFQMGVYAQEIFNYYKSRELQYSVVKYLDSQAGIDKTLRTNLVDWLVEVQESFKHNKETLYMAVKIIDLFLGKIQIPRENVQLLGTTALWIAAKFEENNIPSIDDFCYVCCDAYPTEQVKGMEVSILKELKYDIGFPLSYRFLRRFARVGKFETETWTLASFILESSLMEYDFIDIRDSMMASAVLWLALYIQGHEQPWTPTLAYYSGYKSTDLHDLTKRLLTMLRNPPNQVKTIRSMYSHAVFYGVAKIPLPDQINI